MAYRKVEQMGDPVSKEYVANAGITPGHLIERMSTNKVRVHATAGGNAQRMFALTNELEGDEIETAYVAGDIVHCGIFNGGDEAAGILTTSQTVVIGDFLESAGDGTVRKHTAGSAGVVEYPESIVGTAVEAVTTTSAVARIRIEIV